LLSLNTAAVMALANGVVEGGFFMLLILKPYVLEVLVTELKVTTRMFADWI